MSNYVAIQDLDLSNATIAGFNGCSVEISEADIVLLGCFGCIVAKYPFDLNSRYRHVRGLPDDICVDENGDLEVFEIDYDDEDYFGGDEQSEEILDEYSYISTMCFTIVLKHSS